MAYALAWLVAMIAAPHTPSTHASVPQLCPQAPQLFGSVCTSPQLQHPVAHDVKPGSHV